MKLVVFLFITMNFCACSNQKSGIKENNKLTNTHNLHIIKDRLYVDASINGDSIKLFFDTGVFFGFTATDSFISKYAYDSIAKVCNKDVGCSMGGYKIPPIFIDSSIVTYPKVIKNNYHGENLIAPNYREDKRIWEINFEHEYIKIHEQDTVPNNSFILPFRYSKDSLAILVKMPLTLVSGRDTLCTNNEYILDIGGCVPPFILFEIDDTMIKFSDKAKHIDIADEWAMTLKHKGKRRLLRYFETDKIIIPDFCTINHISRCRIDETPRGASLISFCPKETKGTIGTGLFKYFNVFIDLKRQQLMLVNHDKIVSNYATNVSRLGFSAGFYPDNNLIDVHNIQIGGVAEKAGLKLKDKITSINGINSITHQTIDSLMDLPAGTPIIIEVERDKKNITIRSEVYEPL